MSVITTYLNDNAQTPLGGFVVYMLYKQVCNKHGDKSNRWRLISSPPSRTRLIANHRLPWRLFS